ncbi:hypothetical protein DMENIID0001_053560 [Sergentomyia squamirostris]
MHTMYVFLQIYGYNRAGGPRGVCKASAGGLMFGHLTLYAGRMPRRSCLLRDVGKLDSSDADEYEKRYVESSKELSSEEEAADDDVWKSNFTPTDEW